MEEARHFDRPAGPAPHRLRSAHAPPAAPHRHVPLSALPLNSRQARRSSPAIPSVSSVILLGPSFGSSKWMLTCCSWSLISSSVMLVLVEGIVEDRASAPGKSQPRQGRAHHGRSYQWLGDVVQPWARIPVGPHRNRAAMEGTGRQQIVLGTEADLRLY
jgi:hypothetical protein